MVERCFSLRSEMYTPEMSLPAMKPFSKLLFLLALKMGIAPDLMTS